MFPQTRRTCHQKSALKGLGGAWIGERASKCCSSNYGAVAEVGKVIQMNSNDFYFWVQGNWRI